MKTKVLMFLSASQFQVQVWEDGALTHGQVFSDNQEGREQFAVFLRTWHYPAYLLTDLIEEDFRHETILHLRGKERNAQIQRKFEQFYRNTPFREATMRQRQQEGRRDDEMLFSALTNPSLIQTWLDIMLQEHIPLVGIYSVPGITRPLVSNLPSDHILLLTWEKSAGLRQTYFNAKRLYLSRLTPVTEELSFCDVIATEATRTQQYLKSLSLLPLGQTLQVYIVCDAGDRRELQSRLHDTGDMAYAYLDIRQLSHDFGLHNDHPDSDATPLLLHLLATEPPSTHYANAEHTHYYGLWHANRRLLWLSVLTAFAGMAWGSINMWEEGRMNADSAALHAQAQQLTQRSRQIIQGFPAQLAPADDMKSVVTSLRKLNGYSPPPEEVWNGLSAVLEAFPRIRIDRLSWQSGSVAAKGENPDSQVMRVSGQLEGWGNGYRDSLNYLNRFRQALKQRNYEVTDLVLPLDVSSKGSISDSVLEGNGEPANFSLQLTWKQP